MTFDKLNLADGIACNWFNRRSGPRPTFTVKSLFCSSLVYQFFLRLFLLRLFISISFALTLFNSFNREKLHAKIKKTTSLNTSTSHIRFFRNFMHKILFLNLRYSICDIRARKIFAQYCDLREKSCYLIIEKQERNEPPTTSKKWAHTLATNTDFPASARENYDVNFRFSPEKSETGLSVSRLPRPEGCHPRQWGCGPSRLRYAPARI